MKVILVWLLISYNPHVANRDLIDAHVIAAYTTKSACEAAAETYVEKEWRDKKLGRFGPKTPPWFPNEYSCTDEQVDPK